MRSWMRSKGFPEVCALGWAFLGLGSVFWGVIIPRAHLDGRCISKQALWPTLPLKKQQDSRKDGGSGVRPADVWIFTTLLPALWLSAVCLTPWGLFLPLKSVLTDTCSVELLRKLFEVIY